MSRFVCQLLNCGVYIFSLTLFQYIVSSSLLVQRSFAYAPMRTPASKRNSILDETLTTLRLVVPRNTDWFFILLAAILRALARYIVCLPNRVRTVTRLVLHIVTDECLTRWIGGVGPTRPRRQRSERFSQRIRTFDSLKAKKLSLAKEEV